MDLEFTSDQLELRDNARSVLATECPASLVRTVYDGEGNGDKLWSTLVDLGWPAIGVAEANGGLGLGFVEVALVVEELGRVVAPTPFLATVTQFAPLVRGSEFEARVAAGELTGAAVFDSNVVAKGSTLNGEARYVPDAASAEEIAVVVGDRVYVVPAASAGVDPVTVLDPTMPLAHVTLSDVEVSADRVLEIDVAAARDEAVVALALSTVATCRATFELTLEYAKQRHQFGKPIGSFQALKHRFANMYLEVEKAAAVGYYAALTIAENDERRNAAASMAKAAAGECQRLVARDGLQIHGGIGFTWEHDLHFWLKRAKAGDALLGNSAFHRARLAHLLGLTAASAGGRAS
ncbi:MAG: acyl-CoA dehydrogenase family protein [Acidimicrobiales bacterium]|nr:acyl-CoA dehydrogenase family protein [Acidimicrobiales bacterium]